MPSNPEFFTQNRQIWNVAKTCPNTIKHINQPTYFVVIEEVISYVGSEKNNMYIGIF